MIKEVRPFVDENPMKKLVTELFHKMELLKNSEPHPEARALILECLALCQELKDDCFIEESPPPSRMAFGVERKNREKETL